MFFFIGSDIVGPGFDGEVSHFVRGKSGGGDFDGADTLEEVGDAAGAAHGASVFVASDTDVGRGTIFVIGNGFDEHGHAAGGVGFIGDFFQSGSFEFAGAFFHGAIDIVVGHIGTAGSEEGGAETGIGVGVFPAMFDGDDDFTGEFTEDFAFFGVNDGFEAFYFGPFIVTCHAR